MPLSNENPHQLTGHAIVPSLQSVYRISADTRSVTSGEHPSVTHLIYSSLALEITDFVKMYSFQSYNRCTDFIEAGVVNKFIWVGLFVQHGHTNRLFEEYRVLCDQQVQSRFKVAANGVLPCLSSL